MRAQVSSIDAFKDTATNVNTRLNVVNLALQGLTDIGTSVKKAASTSTIVLNNNGQTSGQITAQALVAAVEGRSPGLHALWLAVFGAAFGALAVLGYRRDEGERFR